MGPGFGAAAGRASDIVVGTPGRLMDNLQSGHLDISGVEYFVLDEADQMLDMGFSDDVRRMFFRPAASVHVESWVQRRSSLALNFSVIRT